MSLEQCPADLMSELALVTRESDERGLEQVDALLRRYEGDGRLHFLRGSLLAGLRRYGEARLAMRRALDVAPGFNLARFQLGFLELTSGDAAAAGGAWRPLDNLPGDNPLRLFAQGLERLARDEFEPAIVLLEQGIAHNTETPPLNDDMRLVISEIRRKVSGAVGPAEEPQSSAQMLLHQFSRKPTKH